MATKQPRGRPRHDDLLTPAEWRVVEAVRHGMSNRQIATRRGISLDAVKFHVANAVGKLGLKDRVALRRWDGISRASAMHGREIDMDQPLQLGPIGQIGRSVKNIAEAEHWYGQVLGLSHLYTFGKLAFFDCGGVRLFLEEGDFHADSVIYLRVPDIRAAHTRMEGRGIEFAQAPHMIHRHDDGIEEWMAFFYDNERRLLSIMSQVTPG